MKSEDLAQELCDKSWQCEQSDPQKAISILKEAIRKYPKTFTVHNYVVPSILRISVSNKLWDEAFEICDIALRLYPDESEWWHLEKSACKLENDDREIDALEIRLIQANLVGEYSLTFQRFGDKYLVLGLKDKAWELYNKAILLSAKEGRSPHQIRVSMAKLLQREDKNKQALEMLLFGIEEAEKYNKKGTPKALLLELKRGLTKSGIIDPTFADRLYILCTKNKRTEAIDMLLSTLK